MNRWREMFTSKLDLNKITYELWLSVSCYSTTTYLFHPEVSLLSLEILKLTEFRIAHLLHAPIVL